MSKPRPDESGHNEALSKIRSKESASFRTTWEVPGFGRSSEAEKWGSGQAAAPGIREHHSKQHDRTPEASPDHIDLSKSPTRLLKNHNREYDENVSSKARKHGSRARSDEGTASKIRNLSLQDPEGPAERDNAEAKVPSNKRVAESLLCDEERASKTRPSGADPGKRALNGGSYDLNMQSVHSPSHQVSLNGQNQHPSTSTNQSPLTLHQHVQLSSTNQLSQVSQQPPVERSIFPMPSSPMDDVQEGDTTLFKQPETRAITQDQLVNEVKGIYAGLVLVEKKCVEIDQQQSQTTNKLSLEQWQALIALHRTLLHEHHDFFLASQHPSATAALRQLATKYAMPARMWRHGIHSFLELLRHRLPDSLDHMMAFVYLAYSMMALLMESVPSFLETWIECLGDLARYRMAIEEADLRDREIWSGVARMWYNKAADRSPNVGRISHHLAVLARPNIVRQLFYYSKALVSVVPFFNARESVMLLFTPFLEDAPMFGGKHQPVEIAFVKANATLFTGGIINRYLFHMNEFVTSLDGHIARTSANFRVQGAELASALIASTLVFGDPESTLLNFFHEDAQRRQSKAGNDNNDRENSKTKASQATIISGVAYLPEDLKARQADMRDYWAHVKQSVDKPHITPFSTQDLSTKDASFSGSHDSSAFACQVLGMTTDLIAQRIGDKNILPYMHVYLAFLLSLAYVPGALQYVEGHVPWKRLAVFLNTLVRTGVVDAHVEGSDFPESRSGTGCQLPEDFVMRGLVWSWYYLPADFFQHEVVDEDERTLELPSHTAPRIERCLYAGVQLASCNRWLHYNPATKKFESTPLADQIEGSVDAFIP